MFSDKFLKFIEMWQKEYAIERSIDEKVCEDKDGNPIPWYTYPAIEYLSQFDYADKKIFEFGCGYSSLFWANRALKVVSVEDNPQWFAEWRKSFNKSNLEIRWRDEGEAYFNAILEKDELYDVIAVDGKCRAYCAATAVKKLAKGGIIILDDSDRINTSAEYVKAVEILKSANLLQVDFYGFCPMIIIPKQRLFSLVAILILSLFMKFSRLTVSEICGLWGAKTVKLLLNQTADFCLQFIQT